MSIADTGVGLGIAVSVLREALRWRYPLGTTTAWQAPRLYWRDGDKVEVVAKLVAPLWDMEELWFTGGGQQASPVWWETPQRRLLIIEGWAEGVRAEDCGHGVGLTWAGCPRYGMLTVGGGHLGGDAGRPPAPAARVVGVVFRPPPPPGHCRRHRAGVERPQGVACYDGHVGQMRLLRHTVLEDWERKRLPMRQFVDVECDSLP